MECVGCADRSCFDLTQHSKATKVDLSAKEHLSEPVCMCVCMHVRCPQAVCSSAILCVAYCGGGGDSAGQVNTRKAI